MFKKKSEDLIPKAPSMKVTTKSEGYEAPGELVVDDKYASNQALENQINYSSLVSISDSMTSNIFDDSLFITIDAKLKDYKKLPLSEIINSDFQSF